MKFFAVATLFASTVLAFGPCNPGLYSNPLCCAVDVLEVADLDCSVPNRFPDSRHSFKEICARKGKEARCCAIPVLGQALLCEDPVGNRD